jgi:hypothetical protein
MSGRYVSRVLESALVADLKFTAAVFASFADDDGRCWPSIGHVAYLRGLQARAVQYHVKELQRMEIFQVVRAATQWAPTHYRIVLDQLPRRPAYRPPDRQPLLLDPSGVQPGAPPPGVQPSVPGVQPVAPDPSVRSVSTHTYPARARGAIESGVQPAAPLKLPLLVDEKPRSTDHDAHAWCGRICVPKFLHRQFKKALGGPVRRRPERMRAFYVETLDAIPTARPIGDEPVKFWRAAFSARFGQVMPERRRPVVDVSGAVVCPHHPQCATRHACIDRTLAEAREDRKRTG